MSRFLICLATLCLVAFAHQASAAEGFADISHADLVAAIADKKVVLLDANGSESYAKGHIPGAIDYAAAKDHLADKLPADKGALIVAYCGGPKCMAYKLAAQDAAKLGYTNIKHLHEGISGWKDSGAAIETSAAAPAAH